VKTRGRLFGAGQATTPLRELIASQSNSFSPTRLQRRTYSHSFTFHSASERANARNPESHTCRTSVPQSQIKAMSRLHKFWRVTNFDRYRFYPNAILIIATVSDQYPLQTMAEEQNSSAGKNICHFIP
jgi:hypothetical protein